MNRKYSPVEKVATSAMLIAVAVVLGLVSKLIAIPHFGYLSFSFTPTIVMLASLSLGPIYGAVVGALSDFLPAIIMPTGAYNFLLTITYALLGVLPWALERFTRHFRSFFAKPWILFAFVILEYAVLVYFFYGTDILNARFGYYPAWTKPVVLAVNGVLDIGLLMVLFLWNRHLQKRGPMDSSIPSLYETAFFAFVTDLLLLVFAKAFAYYCYFFLYFGEFRYSYWLFVSMLLMSSPVQVAMMALLCPWLLSLQVRLHPEKTA